MIATKIVYSKQFEGAPKIGDFKFETEELRSIKDNEILTEAMYFSVDPYVRFVIHRFPVGTTMIGRQIAKVIESKNDKFPKDSIIFADFGWRTHTIFNPEIETDPAKAYVLPSFGNHPVSLGLGLFGRPGYSAYFGLFDICAPKSGEVVVVTGAGGAVGSVVGQLAKIQGCTVIGFAGDDKKCQWLKELGFDYAFNYKTTDAIKELKSAAPNGVDCYFDNVGGELSSQIIEQMRDFGRISVCGAISSYNLLPDQVSKARIVQPTFIFKQLKMEGFQILRYISRFDEAFSELKKWLDEGKLKYRETVTEGFEKLPEAFIGMLNGKNIGKAIIKYNKST